MSHGNISVPRFFDPAGELEDDTCDDTVRVGVSYPDEMDDRSVFERIADALSQLIIPRQPQYAVQVVVAEYRAMGYGLYV